ncbi:hypothetical protein [Paenibacillus sp. IHB B 3415]|uniref:hypothetical protein n=1 Tax=Paenibacillus sp. IHB B 3415 TaxID=867080 RepID=UPI00069A42CE|nr:hypothetical protein [Paenibacillus sp. IHB B 3415]
MIRKLNEAVRVPLMTLLHKDPALQLFIVGDVENFGFERDFMELWGRWMNRPGRIKAVMLRFYGSFLPFAEGSFDVEGFAELVRKSGKAEMLSGSSQVLREFSQVLECQGLATKVVARLCAEYWKRASRMNLQKAGVHRYRHLVHVVHIGNWSPLLEKGRPSCLRGRYKAE